MVKNPPANARDSRDVGSIPGLGRSPGGGHGNPLQYSCLENPKDRGACRAMVHRVTRGQRKLKQLSMHVQPGSHSASGKLKLGTLDSWSVRVGKGLGGNLEQGSPISEI